MWIKVAIAIFNFSENFVFERVFIFSINVLLAEECFQVVLGLNSVASLNFVPIHFLLLT